MKFFSYESKFSQLLLKLCYSCYLNLLWLICSLPIFTMGTATTALYYVSLKVIRGEEGSCWRWGSSWPGTGTSSTICA